jgi:cytochrome b subunit of formate dehydrogenase
MSEQNMHDNWQKEIQDGIIADLRRQVGEDLTEDLVVRVEKQLREGVYREIDEGVAGIKNEILITVQKRKAQAEKRRQREARRGEEFARFGLNFRIQHMVLFTSVIILVITGLPLKFASAGWAERMMRIMGGTGVSTSLHRIGAIGLIGVAVYHTLYTIISRAGRKDFIELIPGGRDFKDFITMLRHFVGLSPGKPKFGRFSYVEKFDYWAVYWGCVIMITSGLLLWFENVSLKYLPKFMLDMAKEAHSDEALLATLAIVIWHFYNVHLNPDKFPGSLLWWHGRISRQEMIEEHPLEYERLMSEAGQLRDPKNVEYGKEPHWRH